MVNVRSYLTNSGRPVTPEMGVFLRTIDNHQSGILLEAGTEKDVAEFAARAGLTAARAWHYIEELDPQYLEKRQDHYVLTLKARAFLVDNNLDW